MTNKVMWVIGSLCIAVLTGCGTYGYQQGYQQDRSSRGWTSDEPREVVMIPDAGVYFVPGVNVDIFFYNNYWWSQRGNNWHRSNNYNGPWEIVDRSYVPAPVYRVPRNYRSVYEKEKRIPYGQLKKQSNDGRQDNRKDDNNRGRND